MKPEITQAEVAEILSYCPDTGVFTWKVSRRGGKAKAGQEAGHINPRGYRVINLVGAKFKAHRLAFLLMTGDWPTQHVDHINGVKDDNKWCNLREVSNGINAQNLKKAHQDSTTGLLGVTQYRGRFKAQIMVNGQIRRLGTFSTPEVAHEVYLSHKRKAHPGNTL